MAKKKKESKPAEDKHAAFLRVVTPRVKKALKAIELIGNQAGAAYAPTVGEVTFMFESLRKKVDATEKRYLGACKQEDEFNFEQ